MNFCYRRGLLSLLLSLLLLPAYSQPEEKQVRYLSGTDNEHTRIWDFYCTDGRKSGHWDKIQVPSCWEQQGFGSYNYGRDYVTYGKNFRFSEERGIYRHTFTVPDSWKNKQVNIVFEGVMTDAEVYINDNLAGPVHRGAFYRFSYDISKHVRFGKENQLKVIVSKMSADKSVNNAERLADYWIFGGIFRPVYLEAVPQEHISRSAIDARADGWFRSRVFLEHIAEGYSLVTEIKDEQMNTVASGLQTLNAGDSMCFVTLNVHQPKLWTAETPHRYMVSYTLKKGKKAIFHCSEKFGFRTIEIRKGDGIYINGVKVKMKGVNRHVWWPETGRTINAGIDLQDVLLIKDMNMNAVRCSHYPPDVSFLNYCDSLGLYVLDELAGWQKKYSIEAGKPLVREMVMRDANHPSIIFWSNGNEGGHNFELDEIFGIYDLSARPVIHAHHKPVNAFNGIDCNHYEDYYSTQKILADTNIYMVTEFLHAQDDGGGAAGLYDMWELHWNSPRGAGGFIWALLDEGLVRTDKNNIIDVNGINAPDGILGPHREKEGSYNAIKEIFSPVKVLFDQLPVGFDGNIPLENRYHFTNLDACHFTWQLLRFAGPDQPLIKTDTLSSGLVTAPSVAPLQQGMLHIPLPANWKAADAMSLVAYDQDGRLLYHWVWPLKSNKELLEDKVSFAGEKPVTALESDTAVTLTANGISVTIDKKTGMLNRLGNDYSKPLSFNQGPVLEPQQPLCTGVKLLPSENSCTIQCSYEGAVFYAEWTMYASGWLELRYRYKLEGAHPFAGLSFSYPENYLLGVKWLGNGPYRVWKNRMAGAEYGLWQNAQNNTQAGRSPWIFPEFNGYFSNITWMQFDTDEGKFTVATPDSDLFIRLFDFYGVTGPQAGPVLPSGNISFLDAIPAVGGKLAFNVNNNAALLGPAGENAIFSGEHSRTLYFYFGTPKPDIQETQFVMPKENILTD